MPAISIFVASISVMTPVVKSPSKSVSISNFMVQPPGLLTNMSDPLKSTLILMFAIGLAAVLTACTLHSLSILESIPTGNSAMISLILALSFAQIK